MRYCYVKGISHKSHKQNLSGYKKFFFKDFFLALYEVDEKVINND